MQPTIINPQINKQSKRPKLITVLIVVFVFIFIHELLDLFRYSSVTDYTLLNHFGLGVLYIVYTLVFLAVIGSAIVLLLKKHPRAFHFSLASLGLYLFSLLVMFILSFAQRDFVKAAYILSREARGLAVLQEVLEFTFSPVGMMINFGIYFAVFVFLLVWLLRNRRYFDRVQSDQSIQATT